MPLRLFPTAAQSTRTAPRPNLLTAGRHCDAGAVMVPAQSLRRWHSGPAPWGNDEEVLRPVDLPDPRRAALLVEILASHDTWQAELDAVRDRVGLSTALLKMGEAADVMCELEDSILSTAPTKLEGFRARRGGSPRRRTDLKSSCVTCAASRREPRRAAPAKTSALGGNP